MKKIFLLIMLIILTTQVHAETVNTVDISKLDITVLGTEPFPAQPGQEVEITFRVTNNGNKEASNVIFEFNEEYPFSPTDKIRKLGEIPAGVSATIKVSAIIAQDTPNANIDIPIKVSPDNGITWFKPNLSIEVRESNAALTITSAGTTPSSIAPGHEGIFEVKLRNDGSNTLTGLEITLNAGDAPIVPTKGSNVKYLDRLKPSQTANIEFPIAVTSDGESGNYAPEIQVIYSDFSGSITKTFDVGLQVFEEPSMLMNIESRDVYTNGDLGNIVFSVANTGTSVLKFTTIKILPGDGYEVIDADSSYLGDLDPDDFQTAEFNIKLNSKEDYVNINTEVIFKDAFNNEATITNPIKLKVFGEQEAIILGLKAQPNITRLLFNIMIGSLVMIFWVLMLIDLHKNKSLAKEKKWAWYAVLILSNVLGAIIYYFAGRKK